MIELPDVKKSFEYENNFYLSCSNTRMGKVLAHYELFKKVNYLPGAIVECGLFKGASFVRFAAFRGLFGDPNSRKLIGFDTFDEFPQTNFESDKVYRNKFINDSGEKAISREQLFDVLKRKNSDANVELIEGDVVNTVPEYTSKNPHLKIALLNLDTDIYEPAVTILENFWPKIVRGGVLILDDYNVFPGETKAVDEYFKDMRIEINKFPFTNTPSYIIKD